MFSLRLRWEHFVIAILLVVLLLENCKGTGHDNIVETSTKITEDIITKKDSVTNNNIKNREPHKVQVIETPEKVEIITDPDKLTREEKALVKNVNRYVDTTRISEGYVISDILSEGRILKLDLKTSIDHLKQTIETTKETTKQAGGLFLSPSLEYIPVYGLSGAGIGFTYIHGSLGIGFGAFYGFRSNELGFRITLHKKIL